MYSALLEHRAKNRASFHTPGHKNSPLALPADLYSLDFTELPDTDSLFEASGPILEAEEKAAALFGAERTCLSAGGCTLCIQAMLRLAAPLGGKVLCGRVVHRSAVNAMALLGIEPVWAMPQNVAAEVKKHPEVCAAYVTSPNYYGQLLDIPAIAEECRERGIPLLVDNAHGTHLMFTRPKLHPLALGASMTADSAHKTLGVLTGGAWLQIGDGRYAAGAKSAMALFGSTSPAYPVMASLDLVREWLETHPDAFARVQESAEKIRRTALSLGIALPEGQCDPARITLDVSSAGLTGTQAAERFRAAGVEPEYADDSFVVLIPSPFNSPEDFRRLKAAVLSLPIGKPLPRRGAAFPPIAPSAVPLREALLSETETVPLEDARGEIAAEAACPCPPGVPAVMPGERITKEAADFLRSYGFLKIKVLK